MLHLFVVALLIVGGKSQCSSNADCVSTLFYPVCNTGTGECQICVDDEDCTSNIAYGEGFTCESVPVLGYACTNESTTVTCSTQAECVTAGWICDTSASECVQCSEDSECESAYESGYTCDVSVLFGNQCTSGEDTITCSSNTDCVSTLLFPVCDESTSSCVNCVDDGDCTSYGDGFTCQDNILFGKFCSNETITDIGGCTTANDCEDDELCDEGSCVACITDDDCGTGATCESQEVLGQTIAYCLPGDQCSTDDDCILGYTCTEESLGLYSIKICQPGEVTCSQDSDCLDGLSCYVAGSMCYLACSSDTDCGDSGYFTCANPEDGIYACLPVGFEDTTTEEPTTAGICDEDEDCTAGTCETYTSGDTSINYCLPDTVNACEDDDGCPTGWECIASTYYSYCSPLTTGTVCNEDGDCGTDQSCSGTSAYAGICYYGCSSQSECGDGFVCYQASSAVDYSTCVFDDGSYPTEEPTNGSGVQQLALFGGMIIMTAAGLFM